MSTTKTTIPRLRYHSNAYLFVCAALRHTQENLGRGTAHDAADDDAHISGGELLDGIRELAVDQFGHGFEGAVFVVYLSLLVNPRFPGAQYALLSGLAFLLPRLLAGLSGVFQQAIGHDGFFVMAGTMSVAALVFLPFIVRARPRPDGAPA